VLNNFSAIKKYVVGLIIKNSSDEASLTKEKVYISKLNIILIEILKYEWPKNWPSFISDIVGASKTNESVCQNNMEILKLLSEEVFDFSSGQMTQIKAKLLKESMNNEFQQVFQLCNYIMANSQNTNLIQVTLETLLRFLNWIPLGYIFETQLIPNLINTFLIISKFRNVTLKCLTEIVSINVGTYQDKFVLLFEMAINTVKQVRNRILGAIYNTPNSFICVSLHSEDSSSGDQLERCLPNWFRRGAAIRSES